MPKTCFARRRNHVPNMQKRSMGEKSKKSSHLSFSEKRCLTYIKPLDSETFLDKIWCHAETHGPKANKGNTIQLRGLFREFIDRQCMLAVLWTCRMSSFLVPDLVTQITFNASCSKGRLLIQIPDSKWATNCAEITSMHFVGHKGER